MEKTEIEVEINPKGFESEYLKCLNVCFGKWGDRRRYAWAFERSVGESKTDLLILRKENQLLAGSAVSYRKVILPNGKTIDVGIMTGSWTLPESRGQRCFSRIIQESAHLTNKKNGAFLLAFVTAENASYRRLAEAGSALFPTYYLVSTSDTPRPSRSLAVASVSNQNILKKIIGILESAQKNKIRFAYPNLESWRSQFLNRPTSTELLAIGDHGWCVIEKGETTDRVQLIVAADARFTDCVASLLARSLDLGRKLFIFTSSSEEHKKYQQFGFQTVPGYLTALVTNPVQLGNALGIDKFWNFRDSMPIADPRSPWFLGEWDIHSGDRM